MPNDPDYVERVNRIKALIQDLVAAEHDPVKTAKLARLIAADITAWREAMHLAERLNFPPKTSV